MNQRAHTSADVVTALSMMPHTEGGFFRETYRSPIIMPAAAAPAGSRKERCLATSILYLVDEENPSRFHRLASDEMWFFHEGAPLEMVFLDEDGRGPRSVVLGPENPQVLAPARVWMAARVAKGEGAPGAAADGARAAGDQAWTLVGCVVMPGFEYEDFERADRERLLREFPRAREVIEALS